MRSLVKHLTAPVLLPYAVLIVLVATSGDAAMTFWQAVLIVTVCLVSMAASARAFWWTPFSWGQRAVLFALTMTVVHGFLSFVLWLALVLRYGPSQS